RQEQLIGREALLRERGAPQPVAAGTERTPGQTALEQHDALVELHTEDLGDHDDVPFIRNKRAPRAVCSRAEVEAEEVGRGRGWVSIGAPESRRLSVRAVALARDGRRDVHGGLSRGVRT